MTHPLPLATRDASYAERPTPWRMPSHDRLVFEQSETSFDSTTALPVHELFDDIVSISPIDAARRHSTGRHGLFAETVYVPTRSSISIRYKADMHLLVLYEDGARREGETSIEGTPSSTLRKLGKKLSFVPAGTLFHESHETATALRLTYLYLDPARLERSVPTSAAYAPKALFEDPTLWATAIKLKNALENSNLGNAYLEALVNVLAYELSQAGQPAPGKSPTKRGGLASWQARAVTAHIEQHLAESISLTTLARVARLSTHHFCRAFKESFGVPPHRYHLWRRMQQAKLLLSDQANSITEVSVILGCTSIGSFSDTFRKITGQTPSQFRRSLA